MNEWGHSYTNSLQEQCDEKIRQATEGLHGIRDKVEEIRVKQDDLILQKAEAALAFAVCITHADIVLVFQH